MDGEYRGEEGSNVFYLGNGRIVTIYNSKVYTIGQYQEHIRDDWASPNDYAALTNTTIPVTTFKITQDNRPLPNPFTK